jgi:uncharacterized membrane protein
MELQTLLLWIAVVAIGWFLLYFIIKTAVTNGIRDSGLLERRHQEYVEQKNNDNRPNSAQLLLKEQYEKGEITFDEYKTEWKRLK